MADKVDIYGDAYSLMQQAEDEICERTLRRLQEHAEAMFITLEKALEDVIPDTRKRLVAYMARKARAAREAGGFAPMTRG